MNAAQMFPLLTISLAIYGALTLGGVAVDGVVWHEVLLLKLKMASGGYWEIRGGDAFLLVSMGLLFVELIRATRTDTNSITNHILSFMLFVGCLLLFIFMPGFNQSVFFIYMAMTLLDPMAGFVVTTSAARRDLSVAEGGGLR
jgi:hypothetical protein